MPDTRSSGTTPLMPPLAPHRRNQSASGSLGSSFHVSTPADFSIPETNTSTSITSPSNDRVTQPATLNSPFSTPPTVQRQPRTPHDTTSRDAVLLTFLSEQQRLFQEERTSNRIALREQHDFMAEQQRLLMQMLVNQPKPTNTDKDTNQSRPGPKARMADPPSFDGSIKDSENFLSSLENIFDSQPSSFPSAESKIRYALTFFTGSASNWRKLLLRDANEGRFSFQFWAPFERRFRETFGNPHLLEEARRKLWTIRQNQRSSEDFFLEFEEIRLEADLCDDSIIMFLQAALKPSLLDDVLRRDPQPSSYNEWKAAVLKSDHNQRNSAATRTFHSNSSFNNPRRPFSSLPFRPRNMYNPPASTTTTTPTIQTPALKTTPLRPVADTISSKDPNPSSSKPRVCWKCGDPSHLARECLKKSSNSKVRALYEQFEQLDSAIELASSGTETIRNLLDSEHEIIDDESREVLERFITENPFFVGYDE